MKKIFLLFLVILSSTLVSNAQVIINEYSASNLESFTDSFGKTEDWIELYNTTDSPVDISGWHLSDKEDKPDKWEIPTGTSIAANGHLVFLCSGRDAFVNGEYHTNFKLAQTSGSDIVLLANTNEEIIEMFPMELTLVEHSRARVSDGSTDWMVCTAPSFGASNDNAPKVNGYTQAPSMSLEAGFYEGTQTVEITNNEPNSTLRYTLDGRNPTPVSPEYIDAITINETQVIKAQSFSNDPMILPGKMDFNTYFIDEDFSLAVFSVAADQVIELANGNGPLIPIGSLEYFNLDKEREATSFGSLNRHGQDSWVLDHRSLDWVSRDEMGYSKSIDAPLFNVSERDEYQKIMFRNSGDDNYPAIDDGAHEGSTHIRDEYVQNLAHFGGMKLDIRHVERVILFLNGEYWGVYGMRDRPVDHDYTDYYYEQGKYDLQYLSTWGDTDIEYGGIQAIADWEQIRNFIMDNDMSIPENYKIAEDSINMTSMIDYMIVNLNVVASDWMNYNTGWWRGRNPDGNHKKWGYILWDLDATFDYYINYSGVPNISPDAEPCDLEDIGDFMDGFFGTQTTNHGDVVVDPPNPDTTTVVVDTTVMCQTLMNGSSPYPITDPIFHQVIEADSYCCDEDWDGICQDLYDDFANGGNDGGGSNQTEGFFGNVGRHEKLFLKLLDESPAFQQLYYARYADMMNTVFSCDNMNTLLDSMLAVIEPEMPRQIDRWGGTMTEWQSNVDRLKGFINERCELLGEGAISCYDELSGPYEITLNTQPAGIGEIDFNTLDIEVFPWSGSYFGGMDNNIKAKVFNEFEEDYEFSHWETSEGNIIAPDVTERKALINITQAGTLTAVFRLIGSVSVNDVDEKYDFNVFPNPASENLMVAYELERSQNVQIDLLSVSGQRITTFREASGKQSAGKYNFSLPLNKVSATGLYFLDVKIGTDQKRYKVTIIK